MTVTDIHREVPPVGWDPVPSRCPPRRCQRLHHAGVVVLGDTHGALHLLQHVRLPRIERHYGCQLGHAVDLPVRLTACRKEEEETDDRSPMSLHLL